MRSLQGLGAALNLRLAVRLQQPTQFNSNWYTATMGRTFSSNAAAEVAIPAPIAAAVAADAQPEQNNNASNAPGGNAGGSWEDMLKVLGSLILFKNRADANGWRDAFENMPIYLQRIGLSEQLPGLSIIHVAGTKGKGSTCAMVESMMRACGYTTGLFTSPHLVDVRERVRINGQMVDKTRFLHAFWQCHHQLTEQATPDVGVPGYFRFLTLLGLKIFTEAKVDVIVLEVGIGGRLDATNVVAAPVVTGITSLGFDHMEMLGNTLPEIAREKAGILKSSIPGFTVQQPADAMQALQEVANRVQAPLLSLRSLDEFETADGQPVNVALGGDHQRINASLAIALASSWEERSAAGRSNPGSAARVAAVKAGKLPEEYAAGLASVVWPGRSHIIEDAELRGGGGGGGVGGSASVLNGRSDGSNGTTVGAAGADMALADSGSHGGCKGGTSESSSGSAGGGAMAQTGQQQGGGRLTFYLDGAHTPESMGTCAAWFGGAARDVPAGEEQQQRAAAPQMRSRHVLLFNCMKERDPVTLLPELSAQLATHGVRPDVAIFVAPQSIYGVLATGTSPAPAAANVDLSWQRQLAQVWADAEAGAAAGLQDERGTVGHAGGQSNDAPGILAWPPAVAGTASAREGTSSSGQTISISPSLVEAVTWLRRWAQAQPDVHVHVLVAGSLYLVGDLLRMLDKSPS